MSINRAYVKRLLSSRLRLSHEAAAIAHHLRLKHALWRQGRLANGSNNLGGGCAQQGDSFEEGVARGSLGDHHE